MDQVIEDITQIVRRTSQYRSDALAAYGLKGCHASYLRVICEHPGISQDKLSQKISINKSNVARQAAALEEDGFIRRVVSPSDKRVTELYPTEKTLALLPRILGVLDHCEEFLTRDLAEEKLATLHSLLSRIKERAGDLEPPCK